MPDIPDRALLETLGSAYIAAVNCVEYAASLRKWADTPSAEWYDLSLSRFGPETYVDWLSDALTAAAAVGMFANPYPAADHAIAIGGGFSRHYHFAAIALAKQILKAADAAIYRDQYLKMPGLPALDGEFQLDELTQCPIPAEVISTPAYGRIVALRYGCFRQLLKDMTPFDKEEVFAKLSLERERAEESIRAELRMIDDELTRSANEAELRRNTEAELQRNTETELALATSRSPLECLIAQLEGSLFNAVHFGANPGRFMPFDWPTSILRELIGYATDNGIEWPGKRLELSNAVTSYTAQVDAVRDALDYFRKARLDQLAADAPSDAAASDKPGNDSGEATSDKPEPLQWLGQALLLRGKHPDWTDKKIADQVGVHPSQLSRNPSYQQMVAIARGDKTQRAAGFIAANSDTGTSGLEAIAPEQRQPDERPDRGQPIPDSKYFQECCADCGEPIRVLQERVGKNPRCEACES